MYKGSEFVQQIQAQPIETWRIKDSAILGWDGGATYGVYELADPPVCFIFTQIADRVEGSVIVERLYEIEEVEAGTVARLNELIDFAPDDLDAQLDAIISTGTKIHILLQTDRSDNFTKWWYRSYPQPTKPQND